MQYDEFGILCTEIKEARDLHQSILIVAHGLLYCAHGLLYRAHRLLYRAYGLLYCAHGLLYCAHGLLYHAHGLLYRAHGLLYCAHRLFLKLLCPLPGSVHLSNKQSNKYICSDYIPFFEIPAYIAAYRAAQTRKPDFSGTPVGQPPRLADQTPV